MSCIRDDLVIYPEQGYRTQMWSSTKDDLMIELPSSANLSTLLIQGPNDYQLHVPDPMYPEHVMVEVQKRDQVYHGRLIDKNDTQVVLVTPTGVMTINHYDTIESAYNSASLTPWVEIPATNVPTTLSYLMGQCSWQPFYHLILKNSEIRSLELIADIHNRTSHPLQLTQVRLVATHVNMPTSESRHVMLAQAMAVPSAQVTSESTIPSSGDWSDIIEYSIGSRLLGRRTQLPLDSWEHLKAIKLYWNVLGNTDVTYGYRFESPDTLPTGSALIYLESEDQTMFIGGASISESRAGDPIDLSLGQSSAIKVESHVEVTNETPKHQHGTIESITIQSTLTNRSDVTVNLILKYWLGQGQVRKITCHSHQFKKGYLEFLLSLKPHAEQEWNCQFQVASA